MEIVAALKRVGAEVVKTHRAEGLMTLYLRVDPDQGAKWVAMVSAFLLATTTAFKPDVSKYFYASAGEVRYLWRIHVTGDVAAAEALIVTAALESAMAAGTELTSFPLVGRRNYPLDPARGKLKGAHDIEQAPGLVGVAVSGGVPGGVA